MSRWEFEKLQTILLLKQATENPLSFLFGTFAIGVLGCLYLWLNSFSKTPDNPKPLKTANDYVQYGTSLIANKTFRLSGSDELKQKAKCANAVNYFNKALTLNSKMPTAYEGRGSAFICQGKYKAGISELEKAKNLYSAQGDESKAKLMDSVISIHKRRKA
ncbi:hypothetical protein RIVM261_076450 [Rivularia sp. IAM M-261]|nr:hypothetical protein RIVM261_076450 [Rivularia sp. IAM M-261]